MKKKCKHCGEEKELEEFKKTRSNPDGRHHICKKCYNIEDKKRRDEKNRRRDFF